MVSGPRTLEILISAHACDLVAYSSFLNVKLEGFRTVNNILGKLDQGIARNWNKTCSKCNFMEEMQKWKIMLDFRLFAVKSMKFSLTRFSKIQLYLFICLFIYIFIYIFIYTFRTCIYTFIFYEMTHLITGRYFFSQD